MSTTSSWPAEPNRSGRRSRLFDRRGRPFEHDELEIRGAAAYQGARASTRSPYGAALTLEHPCPSRRSQLARVRSGRRSKELLAVQCRSCGNPVDPRRVELGYDYCLKEECQRLGVKPVKLASIGVNKAADYYTTPDELLPPRLRRLPRRGPRTATFLRRDRGTGADGRLRAIPGRCPPSLGCTPSRLDSIVNLPKATSGSSEAR